MKSDKQKDVIEIVRGECPLVLGMPHTGTHVPADIFKRLNDTGKQLADTDWHIHQLYAGLLDNVSSVRALFHRYVIDPNRDPSGESLYPGQNTTGLCPLIDFDDNRLYVPGQEPTVVEIEERRQKYHKIYHEALTNEITRVKERHGFAILYDCHSIRSVVPHLFDGKLPDLNIGTFESQSCDPIVEQTVRKECAKARGFTHVVNGRFKGGWTTRRYGKPETGVHAIQMELAQSTYMSESAPWEYLPKYADTVRPVLKSVLSRLSHLKLA